MNDYMRHDNRLWKRMSFKGNKVWVALNDDKSYYEEKSKLLIKYDLKQDYEYFIKKDNIKSLFNEIGKAQRKAKNTKKADDKKITIKSENNVVIIYTDGASSGNPGPSGIGILMQYNEKTKEISEFIGNATNNIAELKAIKRALEELKKFDIPIHLYTDSSYSIGVLTKNWKVLANKKLVAEIKNLLSLFKNIRIIKIKGHSGLEGNEIADRLATSAIE